MFWVTMPALRNHGNLETARETGFWETENGPKPPSMNRNYWDLPRGDLQAGR
jgi:hypothetical protein